MPSGASFGVQFGMNHSKFTSSSMQKTVRHDQAKKQVHGLTEMGSQELV
jgi:hypothetical protein